MRSTKPATQASGVSRARMYMRRDLGWLDGFPDADGQWLELAPGSASRKRVIDGNLTRRSTRTLNMLLRAPARRCGGPYLVSSLSTDV